MNESIAVIYELSSRVVCMFLLSLVVSNRSLKAVAEPCFQYRVQRDYDMRPAASQAGAGSLPCAGDGNMTAIRLR